MKDPVEIREAVIIENQGEKIFAVLHRPLQTSSSTTEKVPAIVICPGFGGTKCGKFRMFVTLGKELAKQGVAVLRFDYRGGGDSEGEFRDITLEGEVSDTLQCLNFLANDPQIDSSRLGILGRSLGGAIAVLTARRFPLIKSLALLAPVFKSDPWRELWEVLKSNQTLDRVKEDILRNIPADIPNPEFLAQFFKLNIPQELLELKHVPFLHIHGEQDKVVTIEHAREFEKARSEIPNSRFIQLPKSDHDFSDPSEQKITIQALCQWFQETL